MERHILWDRDRGGVLDYIDGQRHGVVGCERRTEASGLSVSVSKKSGTCNKNAAAEVSTHSIAIRARVVPGSFFGVSEINESPNKKWEHHVECVDMQRTSIYHRKYECGQQQQPHTDRLGASRHIERRDGNPLHFSGIL